MLDGTPSTSARARSDDLIDFGDIPEDVNALLQKGVAAYRASKTEAETWFGRALALAPDSLPVYFCLYKIHTYAGELDAALSAAEAGLKQAATQAGWSTNYEEWPLAPAVMSADDPSRFALYTLKALAFISLKRGEATKGRDILRRLAILDPKGYVGWHVIADLAAGLS